MEVVNNSAAVFVIHSSKKLVVYMKKSLSQKQRMAKEYHTESSFSCRKSQEIQMSTVFSFDKKLFPFVSQDYTE